jgi:sulfonate dioxygenase
LSFSVAKTLRISAPRSRRSSASILADCTSTFVALTLSLERSAKTSIQPVGAHVQDHIELHNIYLGPDNLYRAQRRSTRLTTTGYHSDVSYEHQPPAITILTLLQVPSTGGDTGWVSQVAAYERLSPPIQKLLEGLRAEHSGYPQAENAARDGKHVRRAPVISKHPIVRIHPATGEKALFINPGFTKKIEGLKEEESDALLKLLFNVRSIPAILKHC